MCSIIALLALQRATACGAILKSGFQTCSVFQARNAQNNQYNNERDADGGKTAADALGWYNQPLVDDPAVSAKPTACSASSSRNTRHDEDEAVARRLPIPSKEAHVPVVLHGETSSGDPINGCQSGDDQTDEYRPKLLA